MDVLGVRAMKSQKAMKRSRRDKAVKVVYISSPMKVKASASEFRALVQELTGRHSDAERAFMEMEMEMDINAGVGGHISSTHRPIAGHHHHDHQKIRTAHEEIDGRDDHDQSFDVFGFCTDFPLEFGNGTSSSLFSARSFT